MKGNKTRICLAAGLSALALLTGCGESEDTVARKDVVVETCIPERGDLTITGSFMATIAPQQEVYVVPLVNGEVETVDVRAGDYVQEGTQLGKIDDTAARLQLESANASLGTVQANETAALGGATTLQNMQTEANIKTIKDSIDALSDNREKLTDAQEELQDQMKKLADAKLKAKTAYDTARDNYQAAKALMEDPSNQAAQETLAASGIEISETNPAVAVAAACKAARDGAKQAYDQVKASYDQNYPVLQQQYDELTSSQKELDRNENTLKDNLKLAEDSYALSKGQVADETAAVYNAQEQSARVGVESARYQQDLYTLKAPISGVVEAVQIKVHDFATTGSPAFIISDKDRMKATFKVSEDIRGTLTKGDPVRVERGEMTFEGTITEIGQMVDMQSGLFLIEAQVKAGGDELLTGSSVRLSVPTYKEKDTLIIPYDAILYDNSEAYVYVVKEGKAVRTPVEVALFDEERAAIAGGITDTDEVVTTYSSALADQVDVVVKKNSAQED